MKKFLIPLIAAWAAISANAQLATVSTPTPILKGIETDLFHPQLSQDGTRIMFADANYANLRTFDFESGAISKIDMDIRQAYFAHFDAKNNVTTANDSQVRTEGSTLYITVNGVERAYQPVESYAGYLWESLSPDGQKVMFVAAGRGIIITDLKGNIISEPGNFEAPVWYGNNHILVQASKDDGHQYKSSQILLMTLDGSEAQEITKPESMTFSPSASIIANKVVYTTIDGRLYEVKVNLNK